MIETWDLDIKEAARLLNQTGYYLNKKANYAQAKPLYERALAIANKFFKPDHPNVRLYSENYAGLLKKMKPSLWARLRRWLGF